MNTESTIEKEKEILDLFTNNNKCLSGKDFNQIKNILQKLYQQGEFELIKIYLSKSVENETEDLLFKIDETNQTASLFKVNGNVKELIIPRTIKHKSTEYLITSISGTFNNNIRSIKFEDSAVKTIYRNAF